MLDIGSLDINGSNKDLFKNCEYMGVDIGPGKNVDVVSEAHRLGIPSEHFTTIISTECFEHDLYYEKSLMNAVRMLAPEGLLVFTCATLGREEHGTERTSPKMSPFTSALSEWKNYYKNLTEIDIRGAIPVNEIFKSYNFAVVQTDLQFWGIKKI